MEESIIEASKKAKTNGFLGFFKKKSVIAVIIVTVLGGSAWYFLGSKDSDKDQDIVVQKEWTVKKNDIKISIESDGKVVAEDGVDLSFSVSGDTLVVVETFIDEGDVVKKGDKIARVEADTLELNVRASYASYQSALATYNDKLDGASSEDEAKSNNAIKQAELSLEQAKISLERSKANAVEAIRRAEDAILDAQEDLDYDFEDEYQNTIDKEYEDLLTSLKSIVIVLDDILKDSDRMIGIDDKSINDSFEDNLGVRDTSSLTASINTYKDAKRENDDLNSLILGLSNFSDASDIDRAAHQAELALDSFEGHLYKMQDLLVNTITSPNLTQASLDSFKNTITSNRAGVNAKSSTLIADLKSAKDAVDDLDDYQDNYSDNLADYNDAYQDALTDLEDVKAETERDIADAERNIETRKLSLEREKLDHTDLLAPLTNAELSSARSSLTSAAVSLERANNELDEAILISPIDGEVAMLNYKTGDTILKDDNKPMVSIINNDTLFVEVNIEEAEINKLKTGQKAVAAFDALDGSEIEGEISFISLTSKTGNNGIVTYLVRVLFENTEGTNVREGMTAFVDFVTAGVSDVISIPVEAVRNVEGKPSVQLASGEWVPVITGFTDGDDVEVISGLSAGDKIFY